MDYARLSIRTRRFIAIAAMLLIVALAYTERPASASLGSISGFAFNDLNQNGLLDAGEAGENGLNVYIDSNSNGSYDAGEPATTTDGTGAYSFNNIADGTYYVMVVPPSAYGDSNSPLSVSVSGGANVQNANVGVSNLGAISGNVFNDVNGNGAKDSGDLGKSGVAVFLDTNLSGTFNTGEPTTTTDVNGNYSFTGLATSGSYTVRVTVPGTAVRTSPLPSAITVTAGQVVSSVNFGLFSYNSVSGTVFNDVNANGTKDTGDTGITTKIVFLDTNGNGIKDSNELSGTTNASGQYTVAGVGPGTFQVRLQTTATGIQTSTNPADITTFSGATWSGDDFGQFTYGSISGFVYSDLNDSGVKDGGESGLTGKTVYIDANNDGSLNAGEVNTQTNGTGGYTFSNLGPGQYQIRAVAPPNSTQSSADPAVITMASAGLNNGVNIGYFLGATLTGQIYSDVNGNGALNAGEPGVSGVTVFLDTNGNGTVDGGESTTTTNSSGIYTFSNMPPGTYKIRDVVPSGYEQTSSAPSPVSPQSGATVTTNVGVFQLATLGGNVFNDVNGNGVADSGDLGISGLTIYLDANNNSSFDLGEFSTTTDSNGNWSITGLGPGSYKPRLILPSGSELTTTQPSAITTTSGMNSAANNFGTFTFASISGSIYGDFDGDGSREAGEAGLSGKTIFLDSNNDGVLSSGEPAATTDVAGNYTFTGLGPGIYRPRFNIPSGTLQTTTNVSTVTTFSGANITAINFGAFTTASITGTIFNDVNGDGVKAGGDAGLASRVVYIDSNNNGVKDTGEPSYTTATGGAYTFSGLGPGTFQVKVVVPAGNVQTSLDPAPITTTSGSSSANNNFGLFQLGSISGTVYNDVNGDGSKGTTDSGLSGKTVYIDTNANGSLDSGEVSTLTNSNGLYTFSNLNAGSYTVRLVNPTGNLQTTTNPVGVTVGSAAAVTGVDFGSFTLASLSGEVFEDSNANGTQNSPTDEGLGGLPVFLDTNSNGVADAGEPATTTDSSGNYSFTNLAPGTYRPRVTVPSTDTVTTTTLPLVTAASGTTSTGNDLGVYIGGTISGTVFSDDNGNANQDSGEVGLSGVRVYSDTNGNGAYTAGEPTAITDGNGNYSLTSLKVGAYKPRVVPTTGSITSTPTPATDAVISSSSFTNVNFGMFTPGTITGTVFNDVNGDGVRNNNETLLSGKTVYLDANANGTKDTGETSVTTSAGGAYTFTNVGAGNYYVRLVQTTGMTQTTTDPASFAMTSNLNKTGLDFGIRATTPTGVISNPTPGPTAGPVTVPAPADAISAGSGYWMTSADGGVFAYGGAGFYGSATPFHPTAPIQGLAPTIDNGGYYEVASDGGIFAFGDAKFYGSMGSHILNQPVVGMAVDATGLGYYEVASDGGIFAFGDAKFYGSTGSIKLNKPIVALVPTSTGKGYWLVATDGGVFSYGDAHFWGSTGSMRLNRPIVGMAHSANDQGYWMVASDGGIFAFGAAPFYGSMGTRPLNEPIVSIHAPATGDGYWMIARDGGVFSYGSARYFGGTPPTTSPIIQ